MPWCQRSLVSLLLTTLDSPLVLKKKPQVEFCEFSGFLGFSAACFLTVCVRRCFFGFFYTFQLVIGKHLYLFHFALQSHCCSAWAYTAFGGAWLYSARCVWYQVACSNFFWSLVQQWPVKTWQLACYFPALWTSLICVVYVLFLFLFYYFALFETRLQKDFCF